MAEPRLSLTNVSKHFRLPHEKHSSLKAAVINWHRRSYEQLEVLKNINLEVKDGEFFGIIGRNGSGKSTLLKILAGIYQPSSGGVTVNGKLTPFIELGVGFNSELTGRDNVFLNGAILGLTRTQIEEKYNEIVAFAELEKFMDQKLKNYSSGMQVRLAFSVAIQAHSDILLLDEVLAVGDEGFQRKCFQYFSKLKKERKTVILVSHDMKLISTFCARAALIENGIIQVIGKVSEAVEKYNNLYLKTNLVTTRKKTYSNVDTGDISLKDVNLSHKGKKTRIFRPTQKIVISVSLLSRINISDAVIGVNINDSQGRVVFATNNENLNNPPYKILKNKKYKLKIDIDNVFTNDNFSVTLAVANKDRSEMYVHKAEITQFVVTGQLLSHSIIHPKHSMELF